MSRKCKVGDKVKVLDSYQGSSHEIGDILEVMSIHCIGKRAYYILSTKLDCRGIFEDELEIVKTFGEYGDADNNEWIQIPFTNSDGTKCIGVDTKVGNNNYCQCTSPVILNLKAAGNPFKVCALSKGGCGKEKL